MSKKAKNKILSICAAILLPLLVHAQFYTGSQMDFGKNRLQYRNFKWTFFGYNKYQVYFYEGGMEIAKYVSRSAAKNISDIEHLFDYNLDPVDRIQFIVYNKQSEFVQSNIGSGNEEQYNIGGVTRIVGSKVSIYFEGDHQKLEEQIRAGIAEVLINQMMYGGGVKDVVKNSTLLNLPDWFTKGLISYVSTGWNTDLDNRVKDGALTGKYKKFNRLTGYDAIAAGHSIWNYIAETYGESVVSNILYMAKVSRSVESAFMFVLGSNIKTVAAEWHQSNLTKYAEVKDQTLPSTAEIVRKPRSSRVYMQFKVSPDGQKVIYATNELGQYKIWLYDISTNKTKRIMKVGHKLDRVVDYSYPLLAWHPSGKLFSMITEKKGDLYLTQYTIEDKDRSERTILNFDKIIDFSYSQDGKKFAISAIQNGQSDIFILATSSNAFEQITKDIYDDAQPKFVHNSNEIIFTSNRPDDTIRFAGRNKIDLLPKNKDVFVYNYASRSNVLKRITNTPLENETFPGDYDALNYSYLSDKNGVRNRYVANIDSVISYVDTSAHYRYVVKSVPVTNYSRNINEQDVNLASKKIGEVIFYKGKYRLYSTDMQASAPLNLKNTYFKDFQLKHYKPEVASPEAVKPKTEVAKPVVKDTVKKEIDIDNYLFENEKEAIKKADATPAPIAADTSQNTVKADDFDYAKQRNYTTNFFIDYVVSQMDNSFLNSTYQKFTGGNSPIYLNPGFTGLFKIGISDLFEDYRITGGIRIAWDLNSNEYFLSYENRIKRLDRQIVLHRQAFTNVVGFSSLVKVHTHEAKYIFKWPFSEVACIKGTVNARNDRTTFLATDLVNLKNPNTYETWGGAKAEYIFDNTIKKGLNLYNGFRFKLFFEYYRQINKKETDLYVAGLDFRHYQKIHRDIIWANRFAASTSFGKQKLVYYMGGVDNWFNPRFDPTINVSQEQNYAYQTLATNMRGFFQNIRNGNSFAVINSEVRFPVFKYLLNRPIRSDFVNNFQIIGFGDVGTAWTGYSPYSDENSLNRTIKGTPGNPITIILNSHKEPIVAGYGYGLRSRLAGYFIRVDWAYGIEDKVTRPRITYLSFSLDF